MLRLRTKTTKPVQIGRKMENLVIHLVINSVQVTKTSVVGNGYYYYYAESPTFYPNGEKMMTLLSTIGEPTPVEVFSQIEDAFLPPLESTTNIYDNLLQRLRETTLLNIQQENGASYGIMVEDLEDDPIEIVAPEAPTAPEAPAV